MLLRLRSNRGQNTAEYAIVIALIIGAAIAMQTYVKRGLQGRTKDATDYMQNQTADIGATRQYEPYYMQSDVTTTAQNAASKDTAQGGAVTSASQATTQQTGQQVYTDTSAAD
ncbi:MAG: hypothetical protein PHJ00_01530 [Candidatus Omnitrophica bacterium]|nr:hypothetical protein [Candidatus Omnitrophota bacterium]MDD5654773.1 hypothetical protein [Candidatus Omnitrophota bacterium]